MLLNPAPGNGSRGFLFSACISDVTLNSAMGAFPGRHLYVAVRFKAGDDPKAGEFLRWRREANFRNGAAGDRANRYGRWGTWYLRLGRPNAQEGDQ